MKHIRLAKFLSVLALALAFSNCTGSQEPFFRYNSPFGDRDRPVDPGGFGNQPDTFSDAGDLGDPGLPTVSANAEQKRQDPAAIKSPDATPGISPEADTEAAPEIYVHKPGPAGSMCYTCRGKGYVLRPTTTSAGDIYTCPACGGDGRN